MRKNLLQSIALLFSLVLGVLQGFFFIPSLYANSLFTFTTTNDNNWGTGFCYQFNTENTSSQAVSDWVISFELGGGTLTSSFGGVYTNSGSTYEIRSPGAYADPLNPGDTLGMGFCGTGAGGVSNIALIDYAGMGGTASTLPGEVLEDYSIIFSGLQVDITTNSSFPTGYCRNIDIENTGTGAISGWQLDFNLDAPLSSSYSGDFSQSGSLHTINPLVWNNTIAPGVSYNLGFCSNSTVYDYDWIITVDGASSGGDGDILISAQVHPSINMNISNGEIDLGILQPGVTQSGSLFIEVGTNAISGVSITARSFFGGLLNTSSGSIIINNLITDTAAESYTWNSLPNISDDSSSTDFISSGLSAIEINNNIDEHVIYNTTKGELSDGIDDVEFIVSTITSFETPAGDYEDLVTFTITGNF